jgi:hypothetical protein
MQAWQGPSSLDRGMGRPAITNRETGPLAASFERGRSTNHVVDLLTVRETGFDV